MVMAGVAIIAIAIVAIVAIDDHYRGAGPVSRIVGFCISAVLRRIVGSTTAIVVAIVPVAVVAVVRRIVRRGRRRPDKSAREEAGGYWSYRRILVTQGLRRQRLDLAI